MRNYQKRIVKELQKQILKNYLNHLKNNVNEGPEQYLNVFNTGFVVNLKEAKKKAIEIAQKWIVIKKVRR